MPPELVAKVGDILTQGLEALRHANAAGCHVVFESDLVGAMQTAQCEEFDLRAIVEPRWDTLRAATVHTARVFHEAGTIGEVTVGARADLIVVDSLDDLGSPDSNLKLVVKSGVLVLNRFGSANSALQPTPKTLMYCCTYDHGYATISPSSRAASRLRVLAALGSRAPPSASCSGKISRNVSSACAVFPCRCQSSASALR